MEENNKKGLFFFTFSLSVIISFLLAFQLSAFHQLSLIKLFPLPDIVEESHPLIKTSRLGSEQKNN